MAADRPRPRRWHLWASAPPTSFELLEGDYTVRGTLRSLKDPKKYSYLTDRSRHSQEVLDQLVTDPLE